MVKHSTKQDNSTKQKTVRWVVKIGSALITNNSTGININSINAWAKQIAHLKSKGIEVVLVSSGAVAEGMTRIGLPERPKGLNALQALAAIGQAGLIQTYQDSFNKHSIKTAQVLLTYDDLSNRRRYLNARSTLLTLLDYKTLPIINENDTVSFEELRFGDNDTLAATVANLIEAERLVILTDQSGLYNKDPRQHDDAEFIHQDSATNEELLAFAGGAGSNVGTGGMKTKVLAARRASRSGCDTYIASGHEIDVLPRLLQGESIGTHLKANNTPLAARKQWLANLSQDKGTLHLDAGAVEALNNGRSLLSIGVTHTEGYFERGDVVNCVNQQGLIIARGLVNYNSQDSLKIQGVSTKDIIEKLGYIESDALIHRDNLVLTDQHS